jgi:hypothetical protein
MFHGWAIDADPAVSVLASVHHHDEYEDEKDSDKRPQIDVRPDLGFLSPQLHHAGPRFSVLCD